MTHAAQARAAGGARPAPIFAWPIRVYWEDTDAGGVVYHAGYVRFLERARSEWLRSQGIEQARLRDAHNVVFVLREVALTFERPARLDEELSATVDTIECRSASMRFTQCILRPADGSVLVSARVRVACVAADTFAPRRIPHHLFRAPPAQEIAAR